MGLVWSSSLFSIVINVVLHMSLKLSSSSVYKTDCTSHQAVLELDGKLSLEEILSARKRLT